MQLLHRGGGYFPPQLTEEEIEKRQPKKTLRAAVAGFKAGTRGKLGKIAAMFKEAARKKKHPVSEAQRRWAFAAEERGELPRGKAHAWSRRVEGEDLPAKTAAYQHGFCDEIQKLAAHNYRCPKCPHTNKNGGKCPTCKVAMKQRRKIKNDDYPGEELDS